MIRCKLCNKQGHHCNCQGRSEHNGRRPPWRYFQSTGVTCLQGCEPHWIFQLLVAWPPRRMFGFVAANMSKEILIKSAQYISSSSTRATDVRPSISLMCSLQFQLGSCDFLVTQHTRWQGAEWGQKEKDGKEKSTNQSFFALLQD